MKKTKKWTLKLLGIAVLAILVCLCLLGSTMARYTSSGEGDGTFAVALWDLEVTTYLDMNGESISPSMDEYSAEAPRKNTSEEAELVTVENKSDVNAMVSFEIAGDSLILIPAPDFTWGIGWDTDNGTNVYGERLMKGFESEDVFLSVVEQYGVIAVETPLILRKDKNGNTETGNITADEVKDGLTIEAGTGLTIHGEVVWTSVWEYAIKAETGDYENYGFSSWAAFSDAVDTILCMYYTGIEFTITWSAVQASTQPES